VIYDISHRTTFNYASRVAMSQHLVHLAPRDVPHQTIHHHALMIEPAITLNREARDYFGNPITYVSVEEPHAKLNIISTFRVEIYAPSIPYAASTIPWDQVGSAASNQSDPGSLDALQFVFDSPFAGSQNAGAYAEPSFPPGRPILDAAIDLMHRVHADFKYEGGVTDIYTPVDKVLVDRRGVCQDFAHLSLACLRALGLPSRYVSGYLRTHPPEGQERKIGADASHAWLSVWVPGHGWIDLDPTNDMLPGDEHITIAWGRDYGDVSPINGMVLGGGNQKVEVAVDVRPVDTSHAD